MKIVAQNLEGDGSNLITPPNPFSSTAPAERMGSRIIAGKSFHQDLEVIKEIE